MRVSSLLILAFVAIFAGCHATTHAASYPTSGRTSTIETSPTRTTSQLTVTSLSDYRICLVELEGDSEAEALCKAKMRHRIKRQMEPLPWGIPGVTPYPYAYPTYGYPTYGQPYSPFYTTPYRPYYPYGR